MKNNGKNDNFPFSSFSLFIFLLGFGEDWVCIHLSNKKKAKFE